MSTRRSCKTSRRSLPAEAKRLTAFHKRNNKEAPAMLKRLQQAAIENQNVFAVLMDAVRVCSLGQITNALLEVGGSIGGASNGVRRRR